MQYISVWRGWFQLILSPLLLNLIWLWKLVRKRAPPHKYVTVHANWEILFKLHYQFHAEVFMGSSRAGHALLCERICAHCMQCDQIIQVFLFPVFWWKGSVSVKSHRCLGSCSSWKTDPYVAWIPLDLKELGFGIYSPLFQSLCMANSLGLGNLWKIFLLYIIQHAFK